MLAPTALLFLPLLAGVLINGLLGAKLPKWFSAALGCAAMGASFLGALIVVPLVAAGAVGDQVLWTWMAAGSFTVDVALKFDALSCVMALIITGVSFLIHIYAAGYMSHEDKRGLSRFYTYLNLFVFSMLVLVLGNNYALMFVGWEGVGLCSYLLIGFWYDRERKEGDSTFPSQAAKKAFIVNRIGDFGFLIAIFLMFTTFGTLQFDAIYANAQSVVGGPALMWGKPVLWWITALLFVGAIGKSAQIPLYVWLPDAMQGPTPVSALIHAATMVTAGVYMVARSNVLYTLAGTGPSLVAPIGIITAAFAATMALTSFDFKGVLAYSTVSQLGYMFVGVGLGAYSAGVAHLMTHAFFKGLLFLTAGSVLHAMRDVGDIRRMGGLSRKMPITFITFAVAALAIGGFPFLSGFFSKDAILLAAYQQSQWIFWLGAITAGLTALYMFRLLAIAFLGEPRDRELHDAAHESPAVMTLPLIILAVLSATAGAVLGMHEDGLLYRFLSGVLHVEHHGAATMTPMFISVALGLVGMVVGLLVYRGKSADQLNHGSAISALPRAKWYVDEAYDAAIVRPIHDVSRSVLWRFVDKWIIDGVVNASAAAVYAAGGVLRNVQTGVVQTYAALILAGTVALLFVKALL
ncbi:NADH-quinone oxidoreductase subunit L [Candidatus Poribacteria bacterium]|jgi:NADH-quinone oxidoreductase subunit L|nr:NADH-quinone oxidoreductase subunit L [Candidatus Poribacteria bacterium]MBT5531940.1 NADH-quinone oxidoreductase subunit L [Candidatus Poribacteria bacterium]MBT5713486.1 NADH-quinone oxidoreductase subunit L [Candidatus Poribacteria bacterium]MBT7101327.1 NADH-quinone oxidoreductase subunit L [Candidatus Poribacteria bacterium]MBT7808673.1 NADH-quinone oxidoreductase subunit L [Candidatus Poribacteria bacterium]